MYKDVLSVYVKSGMEHINTSCVGKSVRFWTLKHVVNVITLGVKSLNIWRGKNFRFACKDKSLIPVNTLISYKTAHLTLHTGWYYHQLQYCIAYTLHRLILAPDTTRHSWLTYRLIIAGVRTWHSWKTSYTGWQLRQLQQSIPYWYTGWYSRPLRHS